MGGTIRNQEKNSKDTRFDGPIQSHMSLFHAKKICLAIVDFKSAMRACISSCNVLLSCDSIEQFQLATRQVVFSTASASFDFWSIGRKTS